MKQLLTAFFFFTILHTKAQTIEPFILNSTGGSFIVRGTNTQKNFSLVWSVGEATPIETFTATNGRSILTQGFLQPFTDKDLQTRSVLGWTKEEVKLYPIPVRNQLQFDLFSNDTGKVIIQLFDLGGRVLGQREFFYNTLPVNQKIDFSKYAAGPYFLKLSLFNNGTLKKNGVFKILKHH